MAYNKGYNKGGGTKQFSSDKVKQFFIARAVSLQEAVKLCIAGVIDLKGIQDTMDKFTVLQFGMIEVEPMIDKEVMRLAAKIRDRAAKANDNDPPKDDKRNDDEGRSANQRLDDQDERDEAQQEYDEAMTRDDRHDPAPVSYQCSECLKNYKTAKGLKTHVDKKHKGDKK